MCRYLEFGPRDAFTSLGVVGLLIWLISAVLLAWLTSTMIGVSLGILVGSTYALKWYAWNWVLRVVIGFVSARVVWPLWLFLVIMSWFIATPFFH